MNDIIKISILIFVVFCILDEIKTDNLSAEEWIKNNVQNSIEQIQDFANEAQQHYVEVNNAHYENSDGLKFRPDKVVIKALGIVDESDLEDAKEIIESFFGYQCIQGNSETITEDMYINGTEEILDALSCIQHLRRDYKVVYIVDKRLWTKGDFLRGYAAYGNTVIVRGEKSFLRETLIHEIGHTLGLNHCPDLSCIMAINNDEYDSGSFCNKCKKDLGSYEH